MKKSLLTLCVLAFILPLSAQVGPSVTYEKFLQAAPPLSQVGVLEADASLRAGRWSVGCECLDRDMAVFDEYKQYVGQLGVGYGRIFSLDRYHYSPNNPTRTYSLPVWDSPVFLMERSAVLSDSTNTEWHHEW